MNYILEAKVMCGKVITGYILNKVEITIEDVRELLGAGDIKKLKIDESNIITYTLDNKINTINTIDDLKTLLLREGKSVYGFYLIQLDDYTYLAHKSLKALYIPRDAYELARKGFILKFKGVIANKGKHQLVPYKSNIKAMDIPRIQQQDINMKRSELTELETQKLDAGVVSKKVVGALFNTKNHILIGFIVKSRDNQVNIKVDDAYKFMTNKQLSSRVQVDGQEYQEITGKKPLKHLLPNGQMRLEASLLNPLTVKEADYLFKGNINYIDYELTSPIGKRLLNYKKSDALTNMLLYQKQLNETAIKINKNTRLELVGRLIIKVAQGKLMFSTTTPYVVMVDSLICAINTQTIQWLEQLYSADIKAQIDKLPYFYDIDKLLPVLESEGKKDKNEIVYQIK